MNQSPEDRLYVLFAQGVCDQKAEGKCISPTYEIVNQKKCALIGGYGGNDVYENMSGNEYGLSSIVSYMKSIWSISVEDDGHNKFIHVRYIRNKR